VAQTFDIRFAKTAGLAGFFEAPGNRFGWKGSGKLSIDAHGISVAVQRGLTNLFARRRSHRVAAGEITQVYREGDALRLEFGSESQRHILPIWAAGRSDAEQIVKLLPTTSTVELEHATGPTQRFRLDRMALFWVLLSVMVVVAGLGLVLRTVEQFADVYGGAPPPPAVIDSPRATNVPVERTVTLPIDDILAREGLQPIQSGTPEHDVAVEQRNLFESELLTLRNQYFYLQKDVTAEALEALDPSWWSTTFRIETSEPMSGPAFKGFREAQLAVISSWRTAVALQAAGLRLKDERFLELAARQRELAETYEQLVRAYVR
jgi:hypothetical protein